jgi:hypothetical protein
LHRYFLNNPMIDRTGEMEILEWFRSHALALPNLAKFGLAMAILVGVPPLSRMIRLPAVVGLLLCGVVIGPHILRVFPLDASIAGFFVGKLLLMFFAGLEIDLGLFRRERIRSIIIRAHNHEYPANAGHGGWSAVRVLASCGRSAGITVGIAHAARPTDHN